MNQRDSLTRAEWRNQDERLQIAAYERDGGRCRVRGCEAEGVVHHGRPKRMGGTRVLCPLEDRFVLCYVHHACLHDQGEYLLLDDGRVVTQDEVSEGEE
jgi:hypothetical protein